MPNKGNKKKGKLLLFLALIQLVRPKQWVKNSFLLAPILFAGKLTDLTALQNVLIAILLFILASSLVYILNDLKDIEADRKHPIKSKTRPLASGQVSKKQAITLAFILFISTLGFSFAWNFSVALCISLYLGLNIAYTFLFKNYAVIDIFCIALGFVIRVYTGVVAINVENSSWMIITTLCLALFLATIKRKQELITNKNKSRKSLEDYNLTILNRYTDISATGALLFYSIFVLTVQPKLVLSIPFVIYGIFRYYFITEKYKLGESPADILFSDKQLILSILSWICICIWQLNGNII